MKPRVLPRARYTPLTGASGKSLTSSSVITYDNSIASHGTARLLALVSAGPIDGLVAGAQSIFFDDIPLQGPDGVSNFSDVSVSFATGAEASNLISYQDLVKPNKPSLSLRRSLMGCACNIAMRARMRCG